mmetsp:Transcript_15374/g.33915  ORF Transcript_15374/g.33915 Transcript_15374/m.33915 type:complete len:344 (-) Transcript_15374:1724-2755(-)
MVDVVPEFDVLDGYCVAVLRADCGGLDVPDLEHRPGLVDVVGGASHLGASSLIQEAPVQGLVHVVPRAPRHPVTQVSTLILRHAEGVGGRPIESGEEPVAVAIVPLARGVHGALIVAPVDAQGLVHSVELEGDGMDIHIALADHARLHHVVPHRHRRLQHRGHSGQLSKRHRRRPPSDRQLAGAGHGVGRGGVQSELVVSGDSGEIHRTDGQAGDGVAGADQVGDGVPGLEPVSGGGLHDVGGDGPESSHIVRRSPPVLHTIRTDVPPVHPVDNAQIHRVLGVDVGLLLVLGQRVEQVPLGDVRPWDLRVHLIPHTTGHSSSIKSLNLHPPSSPRNGHVSLQG